jgi:hypothetical protein
MSPFYSELFWKQELISSIGGFWRQNGYFETKAGFCFLKGGFGGIR